MLLLVFLYGFVLDKVTNKTSYLRIAGDPETMALALAGTQRATQLL